MTDTDEPPRWPDDVLYIPVESGGKGPDTDALPGTWGFEGVGCTEHADLTPRRWGIVDTTADGWRMLTVDLDIHKMSDERAARVRAAIETLPNTRVHESQSGGLHVFFWIRESDLYSNGKLPYVLASEIDDKLNGFVLAPGWCDGYAVLEDRQPAVIEPDDIPDEWIARERPDPDEQAKKYANAEQRDDIDAVDVYDIINRAAYPPKPERHAHPVHGSSTGTNFMVDTDAETWRCWRHDVTANAMQLLGIDAGIISCGDLVGRDLTDPEWHQILNEAEDRGLIAPSVESVDQETVTEYANALDDRIQYADVSVVELPGNRSCVIIKAPRAGGSYAVMLTNVDDDVSFMVVAPRHAILDYHLETLEELIPEGWTAVHLEGKHRVCDNPNGCGKVPREWEHLQDARNETRNVCHRQDIVTAEDAPVGVCKHWFLNEAAKRFADVVVTVPQLAPNIKSDRFDRLFFDEEQSLGHFTPDSVELMTLGASVEPDGTASVQIREAPIIRHRDSLEHIAEAVLATQRGRQEDAEDEGRGWRANPWETTLLEVRDAAEDLCTALGITEAKRAVLEDEGEITLSATIGEVKERLESVDLPDPPADPDRFADNASDYFAPYYWGEDTDPSSLVYAMLFSYSENPFHVKKTGADRTIRLIGDKTQIFHRGWLEGFDKIDAIAGPDGERFIDAVTDDPLAVEIEQFPYADHFATIPLARQDPDAEDGSLESKPDSRERAVRLSVELNERRVPHIAICGTTEQARAHAARMPNTAAVVTNPDSPAKEMYQLWTAGATVIIYENSVVSRGIDVPWFDIAIPVDPGFAAPYWEARAERWRGEDEDKYLEAISVERELKDRELTNAVLRMSPTYDTADRLGTKLIVGAPGDLDRTKYLDDRRTARVAYASTAADILELLTAPAPHAAAISDVYDALGSEKDFIDVSLDEAFAGMPATRPTYSLAELDGWIDSRYLTGDAVERVINAVDRGADPVTTSDVKNHAPSMDGGHVSGILTVLERKGIAFSTTGESTGGRPPTVWQLSDKW